MSKKFNLLLLHQPEDVHPRTWICLNGKRLGPIFMKQIASVLRYRYWSRSRLNKTLAKKLSCAESTMEWISSGKRKAYPIPLIVKLSELAKNGKRFLRALENKAEYFKVNSASSKPVRIVNRLDKNLAKILGAFMADGSLSVQIVFAASRSQELAKIEQELTTLGIKHSKRKVSSRNQYCINVQANHDNIKSLSRLMRRRENLIQTHYTIELTDEYKDSVTAFARWIRQKFEISPNRFERKKGAWRVIFSNKILARYLMAFFDVLPGTKTYDAFEPKIIRKSSLAVRKCFAKGVLTFDGYATMSRNIAFSGKSKILRDSISEIWAKDRVKFWKSHTKRNEWTISTTSENRLEKTLPYFETNTQKYKLLKWLNGNTDCAPIQKQKAGLSFPNLIKILRELKSADATFLKQYFKCTHTILRVYLKILNRQRRIRLSNKPLRLSSYIHGKAGVYLRENFHKTFFGKIKKKTLKWKNCARFLGVSKAAFSLWKVRKNRVPFWALKKMCEMLGIDLESLPQNILSFDREIAEVI